MMDNTNTEVLSPKWLRRAQRLNPFYKERLKWTVPAEWPDDVASAELALRVAAFQTEHGGLTVDGAMGPKTWESLQGRTWEPPAGEHIVVGGRRVAVPFPVVTWLEPGGLSFYDRRGWTSRRDPSGRGVNLFVLHWDGCTSAHQCFQVLLDRGLSVHLLLDGDGTVYQALDLAEARAWHAGNVNERSFRRRDPEPGSPPPKQVAEPAAVGCGRARRPRRQAAGAPGLLRGPEAARGRARGSALRAVRHPARAPHRDERTGASHARADRIPRRMRPLPRLAREARPGHLALAVGASFDHVPRQLVHGVDLHNRNWIPFFWISP